MPRLVPRSLTALQGADPAGALAAGQGPRVRRRVAAFGDAALVGPVARPVSVCPTCRMSGKALPCSKTLTPHHTTNKDRLLTAKD